ncbi:MAG: type II secretion system F family protein [Armatimonadetes bacterium]|nr:type II secretion system F family protein [Armatimonadota bacterium]
MPLLPVLIGLVLMIAIAALLLVIPGKRDKASAKQQVARQSSEASRRDKDQAPWLTRLLSLAGVNHAMQQQLLAAALLIRPSELCAMGLASSALTFCLVFLVKRSLLMAALGAAIALPAPLVWVQLRLAKRQRRFQQQLPEVLELIATALKSGYSLPRALELVAAQTEPPMRDEAQRIVDELAVGVALDEALDNLALRQGSYDVRLFAAAVQIQTRVGGNLAEMLIKTAGMIRQRAQLAGEIAALTAEGKLSAGILAALPVVLALAVQHLSPGYLQPLVADPLGRYMTGAGVLLMVSGLVMIKRLITVEL